MDENLFGQFTEPVHQASLMISTEAECDLLRALTVLVARSDDLGQSVDETAIAIVTGTIPVLTASGQATDEAYQPGPGDTERGSQVDRFHEIAVAATERFDVSGLTSPERLQLTVDVDRSIEALTQVGDRLDNGNIVGSLPRTAAATPPG